MIVGTFLKMWLADGDYVVVAAVDEPRVNAAVGRWIDSGKTRDTLLELERKDGDVYFTMASEIRSWVVSTPRGRLLDWEWDAAVKEEVRDHKQQAGLPWDEA